MALITDKQLLQSIKSKRALILKDQRPVKNPAQCEDCAQILAAAHANGFSSKALEARA